MPKIDDRSISEDAIYTAINALAEAVDVAGATDATTIRELREMLYQRLGAARFETLESRESP